MITLNQSEIQSILPHREPFLLVDQAQEIDPGVLVKASLYVRPEWEIFQAHFPNHPVFPGNYVCESMAQAADLGILTLPTYQNCLPILTQVKNMRFLRPVYPKDTLNIQVSLSACGNDLFDCSAQAFVQENRVAKGSFTIILK